MARTKKDAPKQYEKILQILITNAPATGMAGRVVTVEELTQTLNGEIPPQYISKFICNIKQQSHAGIPVRSIREGRKVTGYQLPFVDLAKKYLNDRGIASFAEVAETIPTNEEENSPPQWVDNETGEVIRETEAA